MRRIVTVRSRSLFAVGGGVILTLAAFDVATAAAGVISPLASQTIRLNVDRCLDAVPAWHAVGLSDVLWYANDESAETPQTEGDQAAATEQPAAEESAQSESAPAGDAQNSEQAGSDQGTESSQSNDPADYYKYKYGRMGGYYGDNADGAMSNDSGPAKSESDSTQPADDNSNTEQAAEEGKSMEQPADDNSNTEQAAEEGKSMEQPADDNNNTEQAAEQTKDGGEATEESKDGDKGSEESKSTETANDQETSTETANDPAKSTETANDGTKSPGEDTPADANGENYKYYKYRYSHMDNYYGANADQQPTEASSQEAKSEESPAVTPAEEPKAEPEAARPENEPTDVEKTELPQSEPEGQRSSDRSAGGTSILSAISGWATHSAEEMGQSLAEMGRQVKNLRFDIPFVGENLGGISMR